MQTDIERIAGLKNTYQGQRCFIMGNGPSLNHTRLELLADEYVWGFNKIYLLFDKIAWRPKFYVANDRRLTQDISGEITAQIERSPESLFFFPGSFIADQLFSRSPNVYCYREVPWDAEMARNPSLFPHDPTQSIVNTATVTIAGLQLAAYMGFNPIFLIGCDTSYAVPPSVQFENGNPQLLVSTTDNDTNHFSPVYSTRGSKWSAPNVPLMIEQYATMHKVLQDMQVRVLDATVGGRLDVFQRVNLESLFN